MYYKRCVKCQRFFETERETQILCSKKCRKEYNAYVRKSIVLKTCKQCQSRFKTRLTFQEFCCDKCRKDWHKENDIRVKRKGYCKRCGKEFVTNNNKQVYCSRECSYEEKLEREHKRYKENKNG